MNVVLEEQNAKLRSEIQNVESDLREALRTKDEELAEIMRELRLEHKETLQQVSLSYRRVLPTNLYLYLAVRGCQASLGTNDDCWTGVGQPTKASGNDATTARVQIR